MANFKNPYFSNNIPEFWRRWHISLNTWFRDYVYIPLGGSREGKLKKIRNTFIVFGLSGLWHGANWTYVAWGLYHGILSTLHKKGKSEKKNFFMIGITFVLVVIGWILFRAESLSQAIAYCFGIGTMQQGTNIATLGLSYIQVASTFVFILLLMTCEFFTQEQAHPLAIMPKNRGLRWGIYLFVISLLLLFPGKSETFIYFQF